MLRKMRHNRLFKLIAMRMAWMLFVTTAFQGVSYADIRTARSSGLMPNSIFDDVNREQDGRHFYANDLLPEIADSILRRHPGNLQKQQEALDEYAAGNRRIIAGAQRTQNNIVFTLSERFNSFQVIIPVEGAITGGRGVDGIYYDDLAVDTSNKPDSDARLAKLREVVQARVADRGTETVSGQEAIDEVKWLLAEITDSSKEHGTNCSDEHFQTTMPGHLLRAGGMAERICKEVGIPVSPSIYIATALNDVNRLYDGYFVTMEGVNRIGTGSNQFKYRHKLIQHPALAADFADILLDMLGVNEHLRRMVHLLISHHESGIDTERTSRPEWCQEGEEWETLVRHSALVCDADAIEVFSPETLAGVFEYEEDFQRFVRNRYGRVSDAARRVIDAVMTDQQQAYPEGVYPIFLAARQEHRRIEAIRTVGRRAEEHFEIFFGVLADTLIRAMDQGDYDTLVRELETDTRDLENRGETWGLEQFAEGTVLAGDAEWQRYNELFRCQLRQRLQQVYGLALTMRDELWKNKDYDDGEEEFRDKFLHEELMFTVFIGAINRIRELKYARTGTFSLGTGLEDAQLEKMLKVQDGKWGYFAPSGSKARAEIQVRESRPALRLFVPSSLFRVAELFRRAGMDGRSTLCDLGAGYGDPCVVAARVFGAPAVGYDIDRELIDEGLRWIAASYPDLIRENMVRLEHRDYHEAPLADFSHYYAYPSSREHREDLDGMVADTDVPPGTRFVVLNDATIHSEDEICEMWPEMTADPHRWTFTWVRELNGIIFERMGDERVPTTAVASKPGTDSGREITMAEEGKDDAPSGREVTLSTVVTSGGCVIGPIHLGNPKEIHDPIDTRLEVLHRGGVGVTRLKEGDDRYGEEAKLVDNFFAINGLNIFRQQFGDLISESSEKEHILHPAAKVPQINMVLAEEIHKVRVGDLKENPDLYTMLTEEYDLKDDDEVRILGHASDWGLHIGDSREPKENARRIIFELLRFMGVKKETAEAVYKTLYSERGLGKRLDSGLRTALNKQLLDSTTFVDYPGDDGERVYMRKSDLLAGLEDRQAAMAKEGGKPGDALRQALASVRWAPAEEALKQVSDLVSRDTSVQEVEICYPDEAMLQLGFMAPSEIARFPGKQWGWNYTPVFSRSGGRGAGLLNRPEDFLAVLGLELGAHCTVLRRGDKVLVVAESIVPPEEAHQLWGGNATSNLLHNLVDNYRYAHITAGGARFSPEGNASRVHISRNQAFFSSFFSGLKGAGGPCLLRVPVECLASKRKEVIAWLHALNERENLFIELYRRDDPDTPLEKRQYNRRGLSALFEKNKKMPKSFNSDRMNTVTLFPTRERGAVTDFEKVIAEHASLENSILAPIRIAKDGVPLDLINGAILGFQLLSIARDPENAELVEEARSQYERFLRGLGLKDFVMEESDIIALASPEAGRRAGVLKKLADSLPEETAIPIDEKMEILKHAELVARSA